MLSKVMDEILLEFEEYPFGEDNVFQDGLHSIEISEGFKEKSSIEQESIVGRAKAFYFTKVTGKELVWEDYIQERQKRNISDRAPTTDTATASETNSELTLHEITQLIESGQTHLIPNNYDIPSGLNESTPSQSAEPLRRKPWEIVTEGGVNPGADTNISV